VDTDTDIDMKKSTKKIMAMLLLLIDDEIRLAHEVFEIEYEI
jgi:hypothetical protein